MSMDDSTGSHRFESSNVDHGTRFQVPVIKDLFHFRITDQIVLRKPKTKFITLDDYIIYAPFNFDFGPPNTAQIYRLCVYIEKELERCRESRNVLVLYTYSNDMKKRTNTLFLAGCYSVVVQRLSIKKICMMYKSLLGMLIGMRHGIVLTSISEEGGVIGYVHASNDDSDFRLTVVDCWKGLRRAMKIGLLDFNSFDLKYYEHYERVENGDWNWIVQGKLLAFSGPVDSEQKGHSIRHYYSPEQYIPHFHEMNITAVVRLNNSEYDESKFENAGIDHHDLYFDDGSAPTKDIALHFLEIADEVINNGGAVAIHCKQGLGRTGTLICCYMMRYYGMKARETIAFCRIQRPGSVMGPQQDFLIGLEDYLLSLYSLDGGITGKRKRNTSGHHDASHVGTISNVTRVSVIESSKRFKGQVEK